MYLVGTGRVRVIVRVESSRRVERVESDLGTYTYAYCTDTGRSIPRIRSSVPFLQGGFLLLGVCS